MAVKSSPFCARSFATTWKSNTREFKTVRN